jgi:DNA polymerase III subunit delta'
MSWNIVGHEWAVDILRQHIIRNEVRHAYLITGPQGVGRRTLALRFAQAINCTQLLEAGEPCGTCASCDKFWHMMHPDLTVVQARDEEGSPQVGGLIKVKQIRTLAHTLSLAPYSANYRVALMMRFEEANQNAQNAFLKTLEEAPSRAILLLLANEAESLLPTIVSRCEIIRLRPLAVNTLSGELRGRWNIPEDQANELAHLSHGCPGYALGLFQEPQLLEERGAWLEDLQMLLVASRRERFAYIESLTTFQNKNDKDAKMSRLRKILQTWLSFWRDVFICASGAGQRPVNLDCEKEIRALAEKVGVVVARRCTAELERSLSQLSANLSPRLLIEVLLLNMPRVSK